MKKRKTAKRWLHYHRLGKQDFPLSQVEESAEENKPVTICGKMTRYKLFRGPAIVSDMNSVTCPRCLEILKEQNWYCPTHGFLAPVEVENDETCTYCRAAV